MQVGYGQVGPVSLLHLVAAQPFLAVGTSVVLLGTNSVGMTRADPGHTAPPR